MSMKYRKRNLDWPFITENKPRTVEEMTPDEARQRRDKRIRELETNIKNWEHKIAEAKEELEEWQNL